MGISEVFIRRPIATALLMVGILVFGMAVFTLLPIAALPNVDFPTIVVSATLPGASSKTMAASVATPLEQQFAAIPGLAQMSSTSGLGTTSITLQFDLARNIDGAAEDVPTAINAASGLLPKSLPAPPTFRKPTRRPRDPDLRRQLRRDANSKHRPVRLQCTRQSLSRVNGVSQVNIAGQQIPATHVQVDPDTLASRGISLEDVRTALANATTDLQRVIWKASDRSSLSTPTTNCLMQVPSATSSLPIATVRQFTSKIGKVVNSSQSARTGAWYDGKRIELLLIEREPGANTIKVVDQIKAMMPALEASIPPISTCRSGVRPFNQHPQFRIGHVEMTLTITIGLVVLTIFVFLRKVWATIIPSVTVPLALVATAGVMYVVGFNLDNISLMALTIAVGFVVDDAIVMIENIVRYIERGESPFQAAIKGAGQIGFTIVSITFSLIAVFIPLLFMGGIIGRLFREFAVTVSVAVVASLRGADADADDVFAISRLTRVKQRSPAG